MTNIFFSFKWLGSYSLKRKKSRFLLFFGSKANPVQQGHFSMALGGKRFYGSIMGLPHSQSETPFYQKKMVRTNLSLYTTRHLWQRTTGLTLLESSLIIYRNEALLNMSVLLVQTRVSSSATTGINVPAALVRAALANGTLLSPFKEQASEQ